MLTVFFFPRSNDMKRLLAFFVLMTLSLVTGFGQAVSTNGGSIQGTITDPEGGALPNARIRIVGTDTGYTKSLQTDGAGYYAEGPLNPGNYSVQISAPGFENLTVHTIVRTGTVTSGNFKLTLGSSTETIEVNAGAVQVNTEQIGVSDVITKQQIDTLPVNGRNFLDLAQIEPGVILQSGQSFDPTKAGYSAISVGGVSGRTTRILLDGQDITDEFVGTTIFNVSQGAINEFQLNRATQDVSGEITSTGQVLVSTNSGTNQFHGQLFYNFQDQRAGVANTAGGLHNPFQRNQFGGSVGGPILKDKLFFFGNIERIKQDQSSSILLGSLFSAIQNRYSSLPSPYRETYSTVRLDYNGPFTGHYFVRANYNVNASVSNFGAGYELYANRDNTPGIAGGADFSHGKFTHSFRGSYEKFHNLIGDDTAGNSSVYNGVPGLNFRYAAQNLYSGPNVDAPQGTFQSDKQIRYDGTYTRGAHIFKYGYSFNRIQQAAFANFFSLAPRATISSTTLLANCGGVAGAAPCPSDPVNGYNTSGYRFGNGLGFSSEKTGFGLSGGALSDWREGAYVSDSWRAMADLTISAGVRWSIDTGRANQDAPLPLCSDINASISSSLLPCTGSASLLNQFQAGLGKKTNTPSANFAPQIGLAFSPGDHKTVLRASFGIFFEGDVANNASNARTPLLKTGEFVDYSHILCGGTTTFTMPGGGVISSINGTSFTSICAMPLGQAAPYITALKEQYQAATKAAGPAQNPTYVGTSLYIPLSAPIYAANYRTPYSEQWNGGIQREIFKGGVLSVDYLHSSTLKIGQVIDVNHVGAARYLNTAAAKAAVAATLAQCGASSVNAALVGCPGFTNGRPATIGDFAANNLDSGNAANSGQPASTQGQTPNAGGPAFAGANPLVGAGNFIEPVGRSGYDALQIVFREQKAHPLPGIVSGNFQVSYSLSRIVRTAGDGAGTLSGDQFFTATSYDQDHPTEFMGPSTLDRTNELSFGGSFRAKYGPQIGLIGHYYTAPPMDLTFDTGGGTTAQIFQTDVTGDGLIGDLIPGTNPGAYMRQYNGKNINKLISHYNATGAGQLTPAGKALVNAGVLTAQQLQALGGVTPTLQAAPANAIENQSYRTVDVNFSYPIQLNRIRQGLSIEPGVAIYNVGNFGNFLPYTVGSNGAGVLSGGTGTVNGPNPTINGVNANLEQRRVQRLSGTFDQGDSRSMEFQLKVNF
jgi:hypothetical protein